MHSSLISHRRRVIHVLLVILGIGGLVAAGAQAPSAATAWQTVTYRSESFQVPAAWPVHDLSAETAVCPRLDRHAVYLGRNSDVSACPAHEIGVTEAVQVQPLDAGSPLSPDLTATTLGNQPAQVNSARAQAVSHRIVAAFPAAGVLVTISYSSDPAVAQEILAGFTSVGRLAPAAAARSSAPAAATNVGPVLYSGKGFDTCGAPSESAMSAWRDTYGAVGVYIGGANRACPDGNLSATWVQDEVAAGWNLIPLYVGLQAPGSGFQARIDPKQATAQGTAAADDAAAHAGSFGIGAGSPIYYDMEAWKAADSAAVVTFIKAWTAELAKKGYRSGIYGSASPIGQDIAPSYGRTGIPSSVFFAQWDEAANTSTTYFAANAWPDHQRIKQYGSNVTETHGGVTLNIDNDFSDGVVVGAAQPAVTRISPAAGAVGTRVTISGRAFLPGSTTVKFGGVASNSVTVTSGEQLVAVAPARSIAATDITVTTGGGTTAVSSAGRFTYRPLVTAAVDPKTGGYWLATPQGNVYNFNAPFSGSTATRALPAPIVGMAADPKTGGYWLVTSKGNVYNFNAPFYGSTATRALPAPIVGMAADPKTGGYWLTSSKGNVYNFNAPFYGSTATTALPAPIVGMAADPKTGGYWLTSSKGNVYNYNAPFYGSTATKALPAPAVTVMSSGAGYLLTTTAGNTYNYNAPFYGSPASAS